MLKKFLLKNFFFSVFSFISFSAYGTNQCQNYDEVESRIPGYDSNITVCAVYSVIGVNRKSPSPAQYTFTVQCPFCKYVTVETDYYGGPAITSIQEKSTTSTNSKPRPFIMSVEKPNDSSNDVTLVANVTSNGNNMFQNLTFHLLPGAIYANTHFDYTKPGSFYLIFYPTPDPKSEIKGATFLIEHNNPTQPTSGYKLIQLTNNSDNKNNFTVMIDPNFVKNVTMDGWTSKTLSSGKKSKP